LNWLYNHKLTFLNEMVFVIKFNINTNLNKNRNKSPVNTHSNPFSSQSKTSNRGGTNPFGSHNPLQSNLDPHLNRAHIPFRPIKTNYRQIPVRTIDVSQKLDFLKNKFQPHLTKTPAKQAQKHQVILENNFVKHPSNNTYLEPTVVNFADNSIKINIKKQPAAIPNNQGLLQNIIPTQNNIVNSNLAQPKLNQVTSLQAPTNQSPHRENKSLGNLGEINKIYSSDYQQKLNPTKPKSIFSSSKFYNKPIKKRSRLLPRLSKRVTAAILMFLVSASIFGFTGFSYYQQTKTAQAGDVAGVAENVVKYEKLEQYTTWINQKNGSFSEPAEDIDGDGLNNYEEFIIDSNPLSANTCDPEISDSQNLMAFIDPKTCKPMDFKNQDEAKKFEELISLPDIQNNFASDIIANETTDAAEISNTNLTSSNLLNLFGVQNYNELDNITIQSLDTQVTEKNTKKEYLRLVGRIEDYIKQFRSYEAYDRNYPAPVHPAVFLDVSLKYQVPLKYTIAIARTESRFGTDRYTASGNLTRPGQFQNIYSMGLTDGGKNLNFTTWESGVEAFGKWYKKFQDRGVSNCAKWKIYNPNGDYCSKIESLSAGIDIYLQGN